MLNIIYLKLILISLFIISFFLNIIIERRKKNKFINNFIKKKKININKNKKIIKIYKSIYINISLKFYDSLIFSIPNQLV